MAVSTPRSLRGQVLYQVFVRNFSEEGTFAGLQAQLDSIKALGTDILYLLPIHPIGQEKRKGTLGSPYAIRDYRAVNPEYGTLADFQALAQAVHDHGMRLMIDVVYNHTSPDSVLSKEHPEWFFHRPDGSFGNRVGDWSDIIDLDYSHRALWDYQIETLCYWAKFVDGFRCDVAPLIPLEFWLQARKEVEKVRPGCLWLSESIDPGFLSYLRSQDMIAHSDGEMYQAFDICYDYDCYGLLTAYLRGEGSLSAYADALNRQEVIFPDNYVKLRFLENHDQLRAAFLIPDEAALKSYTAFLFCLSGMTLIYSGQEKGLSHLPSLFDRDVLSPEIRCDLTPLISRLSSLKSDPLFMDSTCNVTAHAEHTLTVLRKKGERSLAGIFPLTGKPATVPVALEDGFYRDRLSGQIVEIARGWYSGGAEPVILMSE